jgi:hypothetical protein
MLGFERSDQSALLHIAAVLQSRPYNSHHILGVLEERGEDQRCILALHKLRGACDVRDRSPLKDRLRILVNIELLVDK